MKLKLEEHRKKEKTILQGKTTPKKELKTQTEAKGIKPADDYLSTTCGTDGSQGFRN